MQQIPVRVVGMSHAFRALRADRGSVTMEFVTVLPAALVIVAAILGGFQLIVQQMRVADAASSAARLLGRGDDSGATETVVKLLGGGAVLSSSIDGRFVCATVTVSASAGPFALPAIPVSSTTCALGGGQ
ncbi:TadE-like protein [Agreia bicolorata]|uniref:TadE-like protein n=1 Tax=Agreia bicolorata TaxID=110935 RepID=A0A1T4XWM5_9MICO|nr:TadE family type IV pilus minor pilin [Agreia bicolorata]SKA93465.1 TadE-like protein [Agreia bicolorata]